VTTPAATPDQEHQMTATHQAPAPGHRRASDANVTGKALRPPADDLARSAQGTGRLAVPPHIRPVPGLIGPPAPATPTASSSSIADSPDRAEAAGQQPGTAALPIPFPRGRPRSCSPLQAMEDALNYRRARLAIHCPECQPGARCDDHSADMRLLNTYSQMWQQVVAALPTASRAGP
jgi:hypothetical protein